MRTRRVRGTDGTDWVVEVEWLPRQLSLWRRFREWRRRRDDSSGTALDALSDVPVPDDDLFVGVAVAIGIAIVVLAAWLFVLPALIIALDLVLLLLVLVLGTLAKLLLRRPWTVAVRRGGTVTARRRVVGWRHARIARDQAADDLAAGLRLPPEFVEVT